MHGSFKAAVFVHYWRHWCRSVAAVPSSSGYSRRQRAERQRAPLMLVGQVELAQSSRAPCPCCSVSPKGVWHE